MATIGTKTWIWSQSETSQNESNYKAERGTKD